jgi:phosphoribosyl 1,2-cyclic phosphodiesterase
VRVKFWGVRGSIPTPLTADKLRSRIAAVLQRARPADLASPETREAFLSRLPPYIFGLVGGNTTCIEVRDDGGGMVIVDAGSGIRELGFDVARRRESVREHHVLITHYHYDHLQGVPFFDPILHKENTVNFYSPVPRLEEYIRGQLKAPYFPVGMDALPATVRYRVLKGRSIALSGMEITWRKMKHPGDAYSYRFASGGHSIVFATDSEITEAEFQDTEENRRYFKGIDLLILDSQYTLQESLNKMDWGHTSYSLAVDLAARWGIKTLALFHHEPQYADKKVYAMLRSANWYREHLENRETRIVLAIEGTDLRL